MIVDVINSLKSKKRTNNLMRSEVARPGRKLFKE